MADLEREQCALPLPRDHCTHETLAAERLVDGSRARTRVNLCGRKAREDHNDVVDTLMLSRVSHEHVPTRRHTRAIRQPCIGGMLELGE